MPDTVPSSSPAPAQTIVVHSGHFRLLNILSVINAVVLLLIILFAVIHHHKMKRGHERGFAGGDRDGGCSCERGMRGGFERFHHFRHFGYGRGPGFGGREGFGGRDGGFGGDGQFRGFGGGFHRGMGGMGMDNGMGPGGGMDRGMGMGGMDKNPDQMTDAILQHLTRQLSLTSDQQAKIKPLVQADVAQFQKDAAAMRDTLQKDMGDAKDKIKPLLNADQQKQLDQLPLPGQKPGEGASGQDSPASK